MTVLYLAVLVLAAIGLVSVMRWFYRHRNDGSAFGDGGLDPRWLRGAHGDPGSRKER